MFKTQVLKNDGEIHPIKTLVRTTMRRSHSCVFQKDIIEGTMFIIKKT